MGQPTYGVVRSPDADLLVLALGDRPDCRLIEGCQSLFSQVKFLTDPY